MAALFFASPSPCTAQRSSSHPQLFFSELFRGSSVSICSNALPYCSLPYCSWRFLCYSAAPLSFSIRIDSSADQGLLQDLESPLAGVAPLAHAGQLAVSQQFVHQFYHAVVEELDGEEKFCTFWRGFGM